VITLKYSHISLEERVEIYAGKHRRLSIRELARKLHRSPSSVCRELKRHSRYGRVYKPVLADKQARLWADRQRYKAPLKGGETLKYVHDKIKLGWSPATISGRIKIDHPDLSISYEAIYQWIYYNKYWKREHLWKYLECGHKKRRHKPGRRVHSYTQVLDAKSIDLRPEAANLRQELGHGETDLLESSRACPAALSVTEDRLTRVTHLAKVKNHTGEQKVKALRHKSSPIVWLTMTADRGPENKKYQLWEKHLHVSVYFCHAYHSWEKGGVEHINKKIRRFIPKGANLTDYSWREIRKIENWLNNLPLKCLQYLTPYEKMQQVLQSQNRT
jgi:transposase, IS30 family